jgi:hypothetical protein
MTVSAPIVTAAAIADPPRRSALGRLIRSTGSSGPSGWLVIAFLSALAVAAFGYLLSLIRRKRI